MIEIYKITKIERCCDLNRNKDRDVQIYVLSHLINSLCDVLHSTLLLQIVYADDRQRPFIEIAE